MHGLHAVSHRDLDHLGLGSGFDDAELTAALQPRLAYLLQARDAFATQILPEITLAHVRVPHRLPADRAVPDEDARLPFDRRGRIGHDSTGRPGLSPHARALLPRLSEKSVRTAKAVHNSALLAFGRLSALCPQPDPFGHARSSRAAGLWARLGACRSGR